MPSDIPKLSSVCFLMVCNDEKVQRFTFILADDAYYGYTLDYAYLSFRSTFETEMTFQIFYILLLLVEEEICIFMELYFEQRGLIRDERRRELRNHVKVQFLIY